MREGGEIISGNDKSSGDSVDKNIYKLQFTVTLNKPIQFEKYICKHKHSYL